MSQAPVKRFVKGESLAKRLAAWLVGRSASFSLMPFPEDEWEFTFKEEQRPAFDAYVQAPPSRVSNEGGPVELHVFSDRQPSPTDAELIRRAKEQHGRDGECEIDRNAVVSENDTNGAYVSAWVFVHYTREEKIARGIPVEDA